MDRRSSIILGLSAAVVTVALIAGIVTKGGSKSTASNVSTTTTTQAPATQPIASKTTDLNVKPVIPVQSGTAPDKLVTQDIVTGSGPAAKTGDKVTVKYVGSLWDGGKQFDASWDRPAPQDLFSFTIDKGEVIQGWDQGVTGMKVGGRRMLTIPADLGYGPSGQPPTIPANSTLVFVVDLKKIN